MLRFSVELDYLNGWFQGLDFSFSYPTNTLALPPSLIFSVR
jgi:hypothetical protein